ncbi:hypothetical protein JYK14_14535 [Siccirubricoccus sp. KC 17139]|uniref:DUF4435 domain-containing protein n=1 Tax=Siccirubricoccus soli TaxID=2899147 RepID=A0ABT1D610_9PROT|nr:hypothetical protein [Siccirubricoccus soli]MCO6417373.1 hypothetical protein [Siccirubricoccus soli]MCP2683508.1 hypothetical protein [Siccirubricoccus soli]
MGKYDKDRHQKEMAIRYCLARGVIPCLEVLVPSASDLSETTETLTDIDVLGLEFIGDGGFRRTIFDCKTTNKMSPINRAFWAAGLAAYTGCNDAVVILKNRAVYNHRISALQVSVDLHDDISFEDLGKTFDQEFGKDNSYQSSIDRWNAIYDVYQRNNWSESLYNLGRHAAPVTNEPWRVFRRIVAEIRSVRGQFDPVKEPHIALFLDVLSAVFLLWASLGRDIRRFYDPKMSKTDFEKALRYYIWGGKESYQIRQEIRQRAEGVSGIQEFPAWDKLVSLVGLVITAPQEVLGCIDVCRDLAIRIICGKNESHDKRLTAVFASNRRARQFVMAVVDYMIAASGIPKDFSARVQAELSDL